MPEDGTEDNRSEIGSGENGEQSGRNIVEVRSEDAYSRRSFDSGGYTSNTFSAYGTDIDDEDELHGGLIDPSSYGSRHKALEVAIKEKTKHFLSLVKMDGILTPTPTRRRLSRRISQKQLKHQSSRELDTQSRRTSMSSMISTREDLAQTDHQEQSVSMPSMASLRVSSESQRSLGGLARRPSAVSSYAMSTSPPQRPTVARRLTTLKRSMSGRSVKGQDEQQNGMLEDVDESDHREGVYDSSKKQRVPSWVRDVFYHSMSHANGFSAIGSSGKRTSSRMRAIRDMLRQYRPTP